MKVEAETILELLLATRSIRGGASAELLGSLGSLGRPYCPYYAQVDQYGVVGLLLLLFLLECYYLRLDFPLILMSTLSLSLILCWAAAKGKAMNLVPLGVQK